MPSVVIVLLIAFIVRVSLSKFGTLILDYHTFIAWSNTVTQKGFIHFYDSWSDYLPGYIYVLWFLGKINSLNLISEILLYKLPAILADLATGYLIYLIVSKLKKPQALAGKKTALIASALYLFNPAVLANSTFWGQVDSLTALFSLLSIYFAQINFPASAIFLTIGTLVKPQAALAAPVILFVILQNKWKFQKILLYTLISFLTVLLLFLPFNNTDNIFTFIFERIGATTGQYPYTSVNAFNFWGLFNFWQKDTLVTNVSGYVFSFLGFVFFAKKLWRKEGGEYTLLSITLLFSFFFFTRMHERHLLPALAPLVIAAASQPTIWLTYSILSINYVANLIYSYAWITWDFKNIFPEPVIKAMITLNLVSLSLINFTKIRLRKSREIVFKKVDLSGKQKNLILLGIIIFACLSRLLFLQNPDHEYFDEVYHAFTARRMLNGDIKAWEWWNASPQGFAYEWTHPPLAKLAMVAGMIILGENSLGWRIPAALVGTGSVIFTYLISKKIFKDEVVGLLSASFFSLDGLPLFSSRIGMNDSYLLFFILVSLYLFMKDKNFFASVTLGLAAASKWSTLWAIPIFFVIHFALKKKFKLNYIWFLIIPETIYLLSYLPMFTTGHGFNIFIGMQKQMWWYHTRLKATHPYTSPWYTWPFLIRPLWLYTSGIKDGFVANIYAMSNPIVSWFGVFSIVLCAYDALILRSKKLFLIVFSYLIFFVPWAFSPRIMFLYHYLPSVPFLCMAIGFVLRKNLKLVLPVFCIALIVFIYFYPHWTGIPVPTTLDNSYYWFTSWR